MISLGAPDEILIIQDYGVQINIHKLIEYINTNNKKMKILCILTTELENLCRTDGINSNYLESISNERLNEPLLVGHIKNEKWLIDGNHRLLKRKGTEKTKAIYVKNNILERFTQEFSWRI